MGAILWAGIALALIAFLARAISGFLVEDDWTSDLLPQNIHGFSGPIGLVLIVCCGYVRKTAEKAGKRVVHSRTYQTRKGIRLDDGLGHDPRLF